MRVTKEFDFCYGHRLSEYKGKCFNLHGHNGHLEVTLEGKTLDKMGMVLDFGELKDIVNKMLGNFFDHKTILKKDDSINQKLVEAMPVGYKSFYLTEYNPTAENMAKDIYTRLKFSFTDAIRIVRIKLYETPTSYVEYKNE